MGVGATAVAVGGVVGVTVGIGVSVAVAVGSIEAVAVGNGVRVGATVGVSVATASGFGVEVFASATTEELSESCRASWRAWIDCWTNEKLTTHPMTRNAAMSEYSTTLWPA